MLKQLLHDWAASEFNTTFSYNLNGASSNPPYKVKGSLFLPLEDWTNCAAMNQQGINNYVNTHVFPASSLPKDYDVSAFQNDLINRLTPYLTAAPYEGWNTDSYHQTYYNTAGAKPIAVDAYMIYTVVNATDGNGDPAPWLFLYYLGGYYDTQTLE